MSNPSEFLADLEREHQAALDARRVMALRKANEARSAKSAKRAASLAKLEFCIHPSDDPWSGRCRTLCNRIRNSDYVVAPSATARVAKPLCEACATWLAKWKLFGNNRPLTFRRLNVFKDQERHMDKTNVVVDGKTRREAALEKALQAVAASTMLDKETASDMLIGLMHLEIRKRAPDPIDSEELIERRTQQRRAWHVALARMKLPVEVLKALRGI